MTYNFVVPAEIVSAPSDEKTVEGSILKLHCNGTGNPKPNITWTKEGKSSVLSTSETLELTNLNSEDNGVVYTCKVSNSLGFDEANATITVFCEYIVNNESSRMCSCYSC